MESRSPRPSQEQIDNSLALLGLDPHRSAWDKYVDWLGGIFTRWDWGRSPNAQHVSAEFGTRVWVSTQLYTLAILLTESLRCVRRVSQTMSLSAAAVLW